MNSSGIHHVTAVAGDPQRNYNFYAGVLGLRLVKKTVNFDDPSVYHLYYGDRTGSPGTILTFFPWSRLRQGEPGRSQAVALSFSVPEGSLAFWQEHLGEEGVSTIDPFERFGRTVLGLQDPDGLHLELIASADTADTEGHETRKVPAEHAIRNIHGVTLAEESAAPTAELLTEILGYESASSEEDRHLFLPSGGSGSAVEIIDGSELNGRPGRGTIHHIAFRAADDEEQDAVRNELLDRGYHVTGRKDRQYFRSVYFHEPGGVLFEVATDGPGFAVDEEPGELGSALKLPSWLEYERGEIESELEPLQTL